MTLERKQMAIATVKDNIKILESQEPDDAGYYLQLEHEKFVLEALEKQIPKKPVIKTHKYIGSDDDFVNKYHCSTCNALIINEDTNGFYAGRKQKYCDCGQALDWGDMN